MLYNYHTHTFRCLHASGKDREYVENAIRSGIKTLGFSDHAPYVFPKSYHSGYRMRTDELEEYAESVRALQKEYAQDIRILCGFELEYYPDFHEAEMRFLDKIKPDYCILGQHFFGNEINQPYAPFLPSEEYFSAYISQILNGLRTGDFLYLAHPDLAGYRFSAEAIDREYRRLCQGAKALGIPLEINLLGIREHRHYPDKRFYQIAAEIGNEIVLGADAHTPTDVNDVASERIAKQWAQELGLQILEKPIL